GQLVETAVDAYAGLVESAGHHTPRRVRAIGQVPVDVVVLNVVAPEGDEQDAGLEVEFVEWGDADFGVLDQYLVLGQEPGVCAAAFKLDFHAEAEPVHDLPFELGHDADGVEEVHALPAVVAVERLVHESRIAADVELSK